MTETEETELQGVALIKELITRAGYELDVLSAKEIVGGSYLTAAVFASSSAWLHDLLEAIEDADAAAYPVDEIREAAGKWLEGIGRA